VHKFNPYAKTRLTTLYYLKVTDFTGKTHYKVGVANGRADQTALKAVQYTYGKVSTQRKGAFEVLFALKLPDAYLLEAFVKNKNKRHRSFYGEAHRNEVLESRFGVTETFDYDVLNFENRTVKEVVQELRASLAETSYKKVEEAVKQEFKELSFFKRVYYALRPSAW